MTAAPIDPDHRAAARLPSLEARSGLRLFTLSALYVAQGVPWGFVTIAFAAWLADQGRSTQEIGEALALSTLPWSFKWVWGPLVDRFGRASTGRRRPWILLAQSLMVLTIAAMALVPAPHEHLRLIGALVFLHNAFNALQDVAVDAMAVDLLESRDRGRANGIMYASKYLGGVIGGAGLGYVIGRAGLSAAFGVQIGILLLISLLPLLLRERAGDRLLPRLARRPGAAATPPPPGDAVRQDSMRTLFMNLGRLFTVPAAVAGMLVAVTATASNGILSAFGNVLFVQRLGWDPQDYAAWTGGPALLMGFAGAIGGGFLADIVGPRRLAALAGAGLAVGWAAFGLTEPWWVCRAWAITMMLGVALLGGMFSVSLFALFMSISWRRIAATQFTGYMALLNVSTTLGYLAAGVLEPRFDASALYLAAAGVQVVPVALLVIVRPAQAQRVWARMETAA
ncbi:MAG: MFS transporter [Phycisphaeraceae bacterium]|nr:MFS transporter [Phycisphaeraceae bacterium]